MYILTLTLLLVNHTWGVLPMQPQVFDSKTQCIAAGEKITDAYRNSKYYVSGERIMIECGEVNHVQSK